MAIGSETNVVHTPTVDADGSNALGSGVCGLAQAIFKAVEDGVEWPVERVAAVDGTIGNAVNDFDLGFASIPAEQGDAAAFSA
jgi:hypothetical protein